MRARGGSLRQMADRLESQRAAEGRELARMEREITGSVTRYRRDPTLLRHSDIACAVGRHLHALDPSCRSAQAWLARYGSGA